MHFIVLPGIVLAGIMVIGILFFIEKKSGGETLGKLKTEERVTARLKVENEKLNARMKELEENIERSAQLLKTKENELVKSSEDVRLKIAQLIDQTKLKDIMTPEVIAVNHNAHFSEVAHKMKEYGIRHLPVVDDHNHLVGLISQRMLYQIQSPRKLIDGEWYYDEDMLNDVILKHVMVQNVFTLSPEHSMGKALLKMVYSKYGSIPIVDENNKLVGIVTRKDVLKTAARIYENIYEQKK